MRTSPTHRISASAVVLSLAGCTATHVVANPQQFVDTKRPDHVWVTTPGDSMVDLSHPQVRGDTLVGFSNGTYRAIPMADVKLIRARVAAPYRTALLVGAGALAGVAIIAARKPGETLPPVGTGVCDPDEMGITC